MSPSEADPAARPADTYIPSGRVALLRFGPLLLIGVVVALIMAVILLVAEEGFYFYLITPLVVALPVFGAIWAVVRWGRCRNRGLAGLVGIVLMFVYYAGYWELSYLGHVVVHGPRAVAAVARIGGLPGLPGYVVYRCKMSRPVDAARGAAPNPRPPTWADALFNGIFFSVETLALSLGGIAAGRATAARAYSERLRRWASRFEFRLPAVTAPMVQDAIDRGEWNALAELPRVSSAANANTNSLLFRVEYFAGADDEPGFLTLQGGLGGKARSLASQRVIDPAQLRALAGVFPDLKLSRPEEAVARAKPSELEESLQRLGLAAVPGPDAILDRPVAATREDFRDRAVAASREQLGSRGTRDFRAMRSSLCIPAAVDGAAELKRAGWRRVAVQSVLSGGMMGSLLLGLVGTQMKDRRGQETLLGRQLMVVGVCGLFGLGIPALIAMIGGDRVWKPFLDRHLRGRPDSLLGLDEDRRLRSRVLRVEDARTYHKTKMSGEDIGIALLDPDHRRILLEGLSHRYVIRGEDVTCFWPLQAHEVISIRIDYRIGEQRLALVLATTNPWFHFFSGLFSTRAVHRLVSGLAEALQVEPRAEGTGPPEVDSGSG